MEQKNNTASEYVIEWAKPEDVPELLRMIKELAIYEKAEKEVITHEKILWEYGWGTNKFFDCLVARLKNGELAGMALFYPKFSTWKGMCMYLEDLIVKEKYRRKGIGYAMFQKLMEYAREKNYYAIHWQVLHWNEPALDFYRKLGAEMDTEWWNGRLVIRK
jgi:GNAT superfamily N-acetyltransferase